MWRHIINQKSYQKIKICSYITSKLETGVASTVKICCNLVFQRISDRFVKQNYEF